MAIMNLVAYDVANSSARAKLAARLQAHGNRIQKSVFLLNIDGKELQQLMNEIDHIIDHDNDSLIVIRQCQNCWSQVQWIGQASEEPDDLCWTVM